MVRQNIQKRVILLRSMRQRDLLYTLIDNLPLDEKKPIEVTIKEQTKTRSQDANALMWAGPLKDMAEQGWVEGASYSPETWHEYFKAQFLPETFDPELCRDGYVKYRYGPDGKRYLIGSTTQLTVKGFSEYLEAIYAFGANLGVKFTAASYE